MTLLTLQFLMDLFRLYTVKKTSMINKLLLNHSTITKYHKVIENNMDDNSFVGMTIGIPIVAHTPKSAYLSAKMSIRRSEEFRLCMIEEIPWEQTVGYLAMAVPKSSQYILFFNISCVHLWINILYYSSILQISLI